MQHASSHTNPLPGLLQVSPQATSSKRQPRSLEGTLDQEQITELLQASKAKPPGNPSLKDMIEAGLIMPGQDVMSLTYKSQTYTAALRPDGTIVFDGTNGIMQVRKY